MANDFDDAMMGLEIAESKQRRKKQARQEIENPLDGITQSKTKGVNARGKSIYRGELKQVTFRLSDEYVAAIEQIAANEEISKEEAKRWVVGMGLQAYGDGERPEVEGKVIRNQARLPKVKL